MAFSDFQFPQNAPQMLTDPELSEDYITAPMTVPLLWDELPRKELFKAAMNSEWEKLLELYKDKQAQRQKITRAQDTVLHVVMSSASENTVLKLLDIVNLNNSSGEMEAILGSQNKDGDTPLHLAAALGLDKVCVKMVELWPGIVTRVINYKNKYGETPLFTAVCHGKKQACFVLEAAIHKNQRLTDDNDSLSKRDITHCRRNDGNNILHYAISGEHFDLAYEIIHLYPMLANYFNASGESALHILANMPSVFESGTRFGLFDTIIYYCAVTEPLMLKFNNCKENKEYDSQSETLKHEKEALLPTYSVCVNLYSLIKKLMNRTYTTVASSLQTGICKPCYADEENQSGTNKGDGSKSSENQKQGRRIPPNYYVAFSIFKIIMKLLLVVGGMGLGRLRTIVELKQKHRDAAKIMKQLVDQSILWEYEDTTGGGMAPTGSSSFRLPGSEFPPQLGPSVEPTDSGLEEKQMSPNKDSVTNTDSNIMIAAKEGGRDMLKKVLEKFSLEAKNVDKKDIVFIGMEEKESTNESETPSPVLIAAKRGVTEMVESILEKFPVAIFDQDKDEKNVVLLAAEHRQVSMYNKFKLGIQTMKKNVFARVDKDGNSALHLASSDNYPHTNTGVALQMQREIKWYKYVAASLDKEILARFNKEGKMAEEVFTKAHESDFKESREWLNNVANSFSVVAALIVTVAYMASSTVPGGFDSNSGFPIFQSNSDFQVFTLASLVALCFAVAALITFLGITIRPYTIWDFEKVIPLKLIFGFTCSIISIVAMLVSFCAGHIFTVDMKLRTSAYVLYGAMCVPVILSIKWLSNLYTSLLVTTFSEVPSFG